MPGTHAHPTPVPHPYTGPTAPTAPTDCYAGHDATSTKTTDTDTTDTDTTGHDATGNDTTGTATDAGLAHHPSGTAPAAAPRAAASPPADCLQCGEPTEYPVEQPGIVLCPVCEWQEAQRSACSG
ncbi:hypothetical protein ACWGLP_04930 [Streptomyces lydicus]